jgi:hypothetical protein
MQDQIGRALSLTKVASLVVWVGMRPILGNSRLPAGLCPRADRVRVGPEPGTGAGLFLSLLDRQRLRHVRHGRIGSLGLCLCLCLRSLRFVGRALAIDRKRQRIPSIPVLTMVVQ